MVISSIVWSQSVDRTLHVDRRRSCPVDWAQNLLVTDGRNRHALFTHHASITTPSITSVAHHDPALLLLLLLYSTPAACVGGSDKRRLRRYFAAFSCTYNEHEKKFFFLTLCPTAINFVVVLVFLTLVHGGIATRRLEHCY